MDLRSLGYANPLSAPSPAVQATLAALNADMVHKFIQEQDAAALLDVDEEGEHAPLLLSTLDLSQWTLILNLAIRESNDKALAQLQVAHTQLAEMLDWENDELLPSEKDAINVDAALKAANPHEGPSKPTSISGPSTTASHPFLCGLDIAPAQKVALEDLVDSIQASQTEKDLALLLASGKGPVVPFTPPRTIEAQVASKAHRMWGLTNINLMAPISISMWRTWSNMQPMEVEALKAKAIHGTGILREGQLIPGAFPLVMYDHQKCQSSEVRIHTKQSLQTNYGRIEKYSSAIWNCQRPYFRCTCKPDSSKGCCGDVMWFDQAMWYMVNNLQIFFDDEYPTLSAKFGAFIVWISDAARVAVRHQITFHYIRDMMVEAALQFAADPNAHLLTDYPSGAGVRQIERWIKPANFSAANPVTPGTYSANKRPRASVNGTGPLSKADDAGSMHQTRSTTRGGRGGYNRKFKPTHQSAPPPRQYARGIHHPRQSNHAPGPNDSFVLTGPAYRNANPSRTSVQISPVESHPSSSRISTSNAVHTSPRTPHNEVSSTPKTAPRFDRSSMKGRFLDWDTIEN